MGPTQPSHLCFVLQELQTHFVCNGTKGHLRWLDIQWQVLNLLSCGHGLAGSRGKIPSLSSFPTNLVHQAFDSLCSAWTQVALSTRPDVLCLPWAGWTLNSSVVAQLKPGTTEIQQEQNKETFPSLPKSNQYMDESMWFFPNFSLVWFVLVLPKLKCSSVNKKASPQGFVCQTPHGRTPTETTMSKRFMPKSHPTGSEAASCRDTALLTYLSVITCFLDLVH